MAGIQANDRPPRGLRIAARLCSIVCVPFVRIELYQFEALARFRGAVIVANHRSLFDFIGALAGFYRVGRYPRLVVAGRFFEHRLGGPFLRSLGAMPTGSGVDTVGSAAAVMADDIPILILPEGGLGGVPGDPRSTSPFRTGAARIAAQRQAPVWAFAHAGTDLVWAAGARFPRLSVRRRARVCAVGADGLRTLTGDVERDTAMLADWVASLLDQAATLWEGSTAPD